MDQVGQFLRAVGPDLRHRLELPLPQLGVGRHVRRRRAVLGGRRNVTSRYIVAPKLKMSVRSLTSFFRAVSGAMYSGVPCTRDFGSPLTHASP